MPAAPNRKCSSRPELTGPADLTALWQGALALWSPYLRLPPPIWCEDPNALQQAGFAEHTAHFDLQGQQVWLNGPQLRQRGLLPHLFAILCHEIGHYACCPGSLDQHALFCARAYASLEGEKAQTALVVNLFQDLLINTRLQSDKSLNLQPLLLALRPQAPDPFWNWVLRIYEVRWHLTGGSLSWQPLDPVAEADARLAARLIQPRSRRVLEQMHAFAGLCRPYLPLLAWQPALDLPAASTGHPAGLLEFIEQADGSLLPQSGRRQQLEPPAYAELLALTGLASPTGLQQYYRERAWPFLLPEHRPVPAGWEPEHPEGTRPWELDRPVTDIDWTASLIQSPVVVPGMTTLRRRQAWEPEPGPVRRLERLDLYLDASGSLPDPATHCSALVLAATVLVLSALRLGLQVRVTCYSDPGQLLSTGFCRHEASLLATLVTYFGAATSFPLPLLARRSSEPEMHLTHLILLSDEGYQAALLPAPDGETGLAILQRAGQRAAAATLLLDLLRPEQAPAELGPLLQAGWRLYPLDPSQPGKLAGIL